MQAVCFIFRFSLSKRKLESTPRWVFPGYVTGSWVLFFRCIIVVQPVFITSLMKTDIHIGRKMTETEWLCYVVFVLVQVVLDPDVRSHPEERPGPVVLSKVWPFLLHFIHKLCLTVWNQQSNQINFIVPQLQTITDSPHTRQNGFTTMFLHVCNNNITNMFCSSTW